MNTPLPETSVPTSNLINGTHAFGIPSSHRLNFTRKRLHSIIVKIIVENKFVQTERFDGVVIYKACVLVPLDKRRNEIP